MYTLYYIPDAASLAPHMCLIHADAPHELVEVGRGAEGLDSDWFRALNPHGRVPAMTVGDPQADGYGLIEAAALCLQIADAHPGSGLMPPLGTKARAKAYQWLVYLTNTLQADTMVYNYAYRYAPDDEAAQASIRAATGERLGTMLQRIDRHLSSEDGPWLVGETFTAADYYLLMLAGWLEQFGVPHPPSRFPALLAHLKRCQEKPAAARAFRIEGHGPHF